MSSNSQLLANRANSQLSTLAKLQHDGKQLQSRRMQQASALYEDARKARQSFDPAEFGFEFSTQEIEQHIAASISA